MQMLRRHRLAVVAPPLLILAVLLAVGEPRAADLVVTEATFHIAGEGVPIYLPTDPCRDFVKLHATLNLIIEISLTPTTRTIRDVQLYITLVDGVGTGTKSTYLAYGAVKASGLCAPTDPCYVPFRTEYDLRPTGSCPHATVLVTGGLFLRPNGTLADGSRPGDPTCALTDPVGVACSGFRFVRVSSLLAAGWGGTDASSHE